MGSRAYRLAGELTYEPADVILEVGAERGEGSTAYLSSLGPHVYCVDVDHRRLAGAPEADNLFKWLGLAEETLASWATVTEEAPIRFAWLDGHDWPYDGQSEDESRQYRKIYHARGQRYSREASRESHLGIVRHIARWVPPFGVVAIDDTYRSADRVCGWDGKGGDAVPWLLDHGFAIHSEQLQMVALWRQP